MGSVIAAAAVVAAVVVIGLGRARRDGRFDPLHPLLYPTIYIAVATLAPTAWLYGRGDLGYVQRALLSDDTPQLMALAAVGFAVGAAIPFRRRTYTEIPRDGKTLALAGRLLLLLPIGLALFGVLTGSVLTRGTDQAAARTWFQTFDVAAFIIAPASSP